jgi:peptide/nickel transport system substrate-binding protein
VGTFLGWEWAILLELVKPVEKVLVLRRWPGYKEPEANLADLAKIPLPEVEVEGPQLLNPGQSAIFTVTVGFDHEIVSPDQVLFVKYFLFDSLENLVSWGLLCQAAKDLGWSFSRRFWESLGLVQLGWR